MYLIHQLGDLHGVTRRTSAVGNCELGRSANRVSDVILVIWAIKVLSVPAPVVIIRSTVLLSVKGSNNLQGEDDVGTDATSAWLLREIVGIVLGV